MLTKQFYELNVKTEPTSESLITHRWKSRNDLTQVCKIYKSDCISKQTCEWLRNLLISFCKLCPLAAVVTFDGRTISWLYMLVVFYFLSTTTLPTLKHRHRKHFYSSTITGWSKSSPGKNIRAHVYSPPVSVNLDGKVAVELECKVRSAYMKFIHCCCCCCSPDAKSFVLSGLEEKCLLIAVVTSPHDWHGGMTSLEVVRVCAVCALFLD